MKRVAVVILNYNGKDFLEKFLPGVITYSPDADVIVADNQSTDDSVQFLKDNYPDIRLIINEVNGGFAKGYNDALKKVEAEFYVLLNSDIEVTENWIAPCIDLLDTNKNIAAVQPKILAHADKDRFEHAGAAGGFLDKDFYPFCQGRIFEQTELDQNQYDANKEVFWATGACLFIRSKAYHEVEGLDEDFFAHMEEIDMCWRLKARGYQIYYCSESSIYHVGGGTLNYQNPRKTFLNFRNSLYMVTKNYEGMLFGKLFKRLILDGIAASVFLIKFQGRHFAAVFKSHIKFYGQLRKFLGKRKKEKIARTHKVNTGIYKRSIIVQRFLGGKKSFQELDSSDFY